MPSCIDNPSNSIQIFLKVLYFSFKKSAMLWRSLIRSSSVRATLKSIARISFSKESIYSSHQGWAVSLQYLFKYVLTYSTFSRINKTASLRSFAGMKAGWITPRLEKGKGTPERTAPIAAKSACFTALSIGAKRWWSSSSRYFYPIGNGFF